MTQKILFQKQQELERTRLTPGTTIRVHQMLKEKNAKGELKERIQIFEGLVIARKGGRSQGATFTVRKVSGGVGIERIFPLYSPHIAKIEFVKKAQTRRAKLYFVRTSKKRLKELS